MADVKICDCCKKVSGDVKSFEVIEDAKSIVKYEECCADCRARGVVYAQNGFRQTRKPKEKKPVTPEPAPKPGDEKNKAAKPG